MGWCHDLLPSGDREDASPGRDGKRHAAALATLPEQMDGKAVEKYRRPTSRRRQRRMPRRRPAHPIAADHRGAVVVSQANTVAIVAGHEYASERPDHRPPPEQARGGHDGNCRCMAERLAREQAALRRVATLVAGGAETSEVFA